MELSDNQRLYLQVIFDYFHEHGKWPTYRYLDRKLSKIRRDLDIEKISKSLPGGWGSAFAINRDLNADAILSISAISMCENSEEDLGDFIKTLNFCVERYFSTEEDTVVISSDGLAQHLNMSELSIRKVGLFLRDANEYPIYQEFGSRDTEYKNWVCTLSRNIRYFDGVMSLEKYLEKIEQLRRPSPTKIKSQSNSQQINKDKGLSFTKTRAIVFQHLVHDLLQCLGYKVETNARIADALVDFIAYFPADSPNDTVDEIWIIEVKYRNFSVGKDILYQLSAFAQEAKVSKILLVINSTLNKAAKHYASKRNDLEIWDGYKLLSLLEPFPELRQKYFEVLPQMDNPIDEGDLVSKSSDDEHQLVKELKGLPTGDGRSYEELVKRILEFCFHDEFMPFAVKEQVKTLNEKRIRDFIIDNRNSKMQFWKDLKWVRKVEKLLIDAKNYKNPVEYREIIDTLRYLKNEAFGNFIIIISRQGIKDDEEAVEDYSDKKQIALFLNDEDLVKMINLKIEGESPTLLIENRYYEFLDKK